MSINLNQTLEELSATCNAVKKGDYMKDGFVHCCKCGMPKQCMIYPMDVPHKVFCLCQCGLDDREYEKENGRAKEDKAFTDGLMAEGIQDKALQGYTFDMDDGTDKSGSIEIGRNYADNFIEEFYNENIGMLMLGNVGTGKTFLASCIANALIKKNIPVLMTDFSKIINDLFNSDDKNKLLKSFDHYKLLVIDDLGVESSSDHAMQQVYTVIDQRYKNKQPLIITSNLTLEEIKNPKNMAYSRIYDRILENCVPMIFSGRNRRHGLKAKKMKEASDKFKGMRAN